MDNAVIHPQADGVIRKLADTKTQAAAAQQASHAEDATVNNQMKGICASAYAFFLVSFCITFTARLPLRTPSAALLQHISLSTAAPRSMSCISAAHSPFNCHSVLHVMHFCSTLAT
ncbi:hypothetical protein FHS15_002485 [Paenibacillus castaneae]|nr:hypothetical protein [Paenibacillus castaneae]